MKLVRGVKVCGMCKRSYCVDLPSSSIDLLVWPWEGLTRIGVQFLQVECFELRNCSCGTTLVWPIDLEAAKGPMVEIVYLHVEWQPE